jgi:hypothetical protein
LTKLSLTNRQIIQLHQMAREGTPHHIIARTLRVNRNTVTAHLSGDITYTPSVYKAIDLRAPLVARRWLTMRQAAPWIPGHPSKAKMWVLINGRSWRGKRIPKLHSRIVDGQRMTTLASIRAFVSKVYPAGIWLREETIEGLITLEAIEQLPIEKIGWFRRQPFGEQIKACRLCVVDRVAAECGEQIDIPASMVHRATTIEKHIGTAVV